MAALSSVTVAMTTFLVALVATLASTILPRIVIIALLVAVALRLVRARVVSTLPIAVEVLFVGLGGVRIGARLRRRRRRLKSSRRGRGSAGMDLLEVHGRRRTLLGLFGLLLGVVHDRVPINLLATLLL
mmetsp:Transcript_4083/g.4997  ORF Transcript_4083/g.4997 Transcript_4083/m.4997 type:complete len:129 (-) Transcript_4083:246-632(-)